MKTKIRNGLIGLAFGTLSLGSNAEIPIGNTIKLDNTFEVRYLIDKLNDRICPYELKDTETGLRAIDYNCDGLVDVIYNRDGISIPKTNIGYLGIKSASEFMLDNSKRLILEGMREEILRNLDMAEDLLNSYDYNKKIKNK